MLAGRDELVCSSVEQGWKLLIGLGAGTGLVFILRWYWWRVNAWSEISAMVASFVTSVVLASVGYDLSNPSSADYAKTMLITVLVTTVVWLGGDVPDRAGAGCHPRPVLPKGPARRSRLAVGVGATWLSQDDDSGWGAVVGQLDRRLGRRLLRLGVAGCFSHRDQHPGAVVRRSCNRGFRVDNA